MLNRNFLVGCGVGGSDAHEWWRVVIDALETATLYLQEVEMRATVGGSDLCTGGTPFASTGTGAPYYDNAVNVNGRVVGEHFGYHFASPVVVAEIVLSIFAADWMTEGRIQYSDNGTDWATAKTLTGLGVVFDEYFPSLSSLRDVQHLQM